MYPTDVDIGGVLLDLGKEHNRPQKNQAKGPKASITDFHSDSVHVEALQRMLHIQMYHTPIPGEYHS
jgi:hypothetical protein